MRPPHKIALSLGAVSARAASRGTLCDVVCLLPVRCRYTQFCQALQSASAVEARRLHSELLVDLYAVQAHMQRLRAACDAFRREQQLYAEKQEQLQAAILQVRIRAQAALS